MRSAFKGKGFDSELIREVAWILYNGSDPNTWTGRKDPGGCGVIARWPVNYLRGLLQRPDFKKIALKDVRRTLEEDPPTENQNVP